MNYFGQYDMQRFATLAFEKYCYLETCFRGHSRSLQLTIFSRLHMLHIFTL